MRRINKACKKKIDTYATMQNDPETNRINEDTIRLFSRPKIVGSSGLARECKCKVKKDAKKHIQHDSHTKDLNTINHLF